MSSGNPLNATAYRPGTGLPAAALTGGFPTQRFQGAGTAAVASEAMGSMRSFPTETRHFANNAMETANGSVNYVFPVHSAYQHTVAKNQFAFLVNARQDRTQSYMMSVHQLNWWLRYREHTMLAAWTFKDVQDYVHPIGSIYAAQTHQHRTGRVDSVTIMGDTTVLPYWKKHSGDWCPLFFRQRQYHRDDPEVRGFVNPDGTPVDRNQLLDYFFQVEPYTLDIVNDRLLDGSTTGGVVVPASQLLVADRRTPDEYQIVDMWCIGHAINDSGRGRMKFAHDPQRRAQDAAMWAGATSIRICVAPPREQFL